VVSWSDPKSNSKAHELPVLRNARAVIGPWQEHMLLTLGVVEAVRRKHGSLLSSILSSLYWFVSQYNV